MSRNDDVKTEQQGSKPTEAQRKEEWKNKNGPVVIVAVVVLVIAAMSVAMKMCG